MKKEQRLKKKSVRLGFIIWGKRVDNKKLKIRFWWVSVCVTWGWEEAPNERQTECGYSKRKQGRMTINKKKNTSVM